MRYKIEKKGRTPKERLEQNRSGYVTETPEEKSAGFVTVSKKRPGTRGTFGEDPKRVKDKRRTM